MLYPGRAPQSICRTRNSRLMPCSLRLHLLRNRISSPTRPCLSVRERAIRAQQRDSSNACKQMVRAGSHALHAVGRCLFHASVAATMLVSVMGPESASAYHIKQQTSMGDATTTQPQDNREDVAPAHTWMTAGVLGMMSMQHDDSPGSNHMGSTIGQQPSRTSVQYSCIPLSDEERVYAFELGGYTHKISTTSPKAQILFDQGLMLAYNFNRDEAVRAFETALRFDPNAPMLHWGIAYALGPYLNDAAVEPSTSNPPTYPSFSPERLQRGLTELQQAQELVNRQLADQADQAGPLAAAAAPSREQLLRDQAYINAMLPVFQSGDTWGPAFRAAQEQYASALQDMARQYPEDADAVILAGEALFNLQPWKMFDPETKEPIERAEEILGLLQQGLEINPTHALGLHLMVHGTETLTPGKALNGAARGEAAADLLASTKQSFGHLTHMAAHNYNRVGRWSDGAATNARAVDIDTREAARCMVPYMPVHDMQTLLWGAGMAGDLSIAESYAEAARDFPARFGPAYMSDGRELGMQSVVWARFGQWDEILGTPPVDPRSAEAAPLLPSPEAVDLNQVVVNYTQALALAGKAAAAAAAAASGPLEGAAGQRVDAEAVQKVQDKIVALEAAAKRLPPDPATKPGVGLGVWTTGYNMMARQMLEMAKARLALLQGDAAQAEAHLMSALKVEEEEVYAEPSVFFQPARQCLGAVLLHDGKPREAVQVYLEDLAELPGNVWDLVGLHQAVQEAAGAGGTAGLAYDSKQMEADRLKAVAGADKRTPLGTSCPAFFN